RVWKASAAGADLPGAPGPGPALAPPVPSGPGARLVRAAAGCLPAVPAALLGAVAAGGQALPLHRVVILYPKYTTEPFGRQETYFSPESLAEFRAAHGAK